MIWNGSFPLYDLCAERAGVPMPLPEEAFVPLAMAEPKFCVWDVREAMFRYWRCNCSCTFLNFGFGCSIKPPILPTLPSGGTSDPVVLWIFGGPCDLGGNSSHAKE